MTTQNDLQFDFLSEAPPASPSPSPDSEKEWTMRAVTWPSSLSSFCVELVRNGYSGKMCQVYSRRAEEKTSPPSSAASSGGKSKSPKKGGASQESSSLQAPTITASRGGFSMHSILEFHSGAVASSLSDILETGALPLRYFLSSTACRGILRRAAARGKELPAVLKSALVAASQQTSPPPSTPAAKTDPDEIS